MNSYHYLASPYSHLDPAVMHARYERAELATAWLLSRKIWVYSPIVHCHNMAKKLKLPTDNEFWKAYNRVMIRASDGILVLQIDGWAQSVGIQDEIDFAYNYDIDVEYITPSGKEYAIRGRPV
jgi:hypothetical protein